MVLTNRVLAVTMKLLIISYVCPNQLCSEALNLFLHNAKGLGENHFMMQEKEIFALRSCRQFKASMNNFLICMVSKTNCYKNHFKITLRTNVLGIDNNNRGWIWQKEQQVAVNRGNSSKEIIRHLFDKALYHVSPH